MLSRKGIYAVGSDSVDVTETILMQSAPFKLVKVYISFASASVNIVWVKNRFLIKTLQIP